MTDTIIFAPGDEINVTTVSATTVTATNAVISGNVGAATVTATGDVSAATVTATGEITAASVAATGDVSAATITATGDITCANIISSGSNTISVQTLTSDRVIIPRGATGLIITAASPIADHTYTLPDIGADGIMTVSTTTVWTVSINKLSDGTLIYANQAFTLTRNGTIVNVTLGTNIQFDGQSEPQLLTDTAFPFPSRYQPLTTQHYPIYVRSGGLDGVGFAIVRNTGLVEFLGRDGGAWVGADCRIYPTSFSYSA